ncbi:MAG: DegT/DnrJ/EryC1/StrS family aminotransferase [Firmicutes bacterium]|nr:DegT/DnrJ/EryC1/StrS family aminotransferase [Bacillota bacterium]
MSETLWNAFGRQAWQRAGELLQKETLSLLEGEGVIAEFEAALSARFGFPFVLATSSGTAALQDALWAAQVSGGELLLPPNLPPYLIRAISLLSARLCFVDIEPQRLGIDPQKAQEAVHPATRAVLVVDQIGIPACTAALAPLRENGVVVIEDAAQAFSAQEKGQPPGADADMLVLSFQGAKSFGLGEGGALLCRYRHHYERALRFGQHPARWLAEWDGGAVQKHFPQRIAMQHRISPLTAALGVAMLVYYDAFEATRLAAVEVLRTAVSTLPGLHTLELPEGLRPDWAVVPVQLPKGVSVQSVVRQLQQQGIDADRFPQAFGLGRPSDGSLSPAIRYPVFADLQQRLFAIGWAGAVRWEEHEMEAMCRALQNALQF